MVDEMNLSEAELKAMADKLLEEADMARVCPYSFSKFSFSKI